MLFIKHLPVIIDAFGIFVRRKYQVYLVKNVIFFTILFLIINL